MASNMRCIGLDAAAEAAFDELIRDLLGGWRSRSRNAALLAADPRPWSGVVAVTTFGADVTVHADADALRESDASLLDPAKKDEPPPAGYLERGLRRPVRVGPESLLPTGVFAAEHDVPAPGTVVSGVVFLVAATGVTGPAEPERRGLSRMRRRRG